MISVVGIISDGKIIPDTSPKTYDSSDIVEIDHFLDMYENILIQAIHCLRPAVAYKS